jgi:hypothetical protein
MKKFICLATLLVCALVFFAAPAMASSATAQAVTGAETPDYSLNLELTVTDGTVTGITVYSATGEALTTNADMTGQTPQDAFSATLASLVEAGYLTADGEGEPYLMITTAGGILDQALAADLRQIARDFLHAQDGDAEVDFAAIGADVSAKAATLGLPGGRYLMMAYIAAQQGITVEEAIAQYGGLKVRDLMRNFDGLREAMAENDGEQDEEAEEARERQEEEERERQEKEAEEREDQQEREEEEQREREEKEAEEREDEQEREEEQKEDKQDKPSQSGNADNGNGNKGGGKK